MFKTLATIVLATLLLVVGVSATTYIVQPGDTLNQIAQDNGTSVEVLADTNDIFNVDLIYTGQELNISTNNTLPFFQKLGAVPEGLLGGNDINFVQVQNLYLSGSGISATVTSVGLTSFAYPNDDLVVMTDFGDIGYGVLEPDTSREENISFTGITQISGGKATLTGVTRGLGLSSPYTASTSLRFAHAGGTLFRISNTAPFYNEFNIKGKDETITGVWTFNALPESSLSATNTNQFTIKSYVDNLINQGASTSTETTAGISELATYKESASSTPWGVTEPHVQQSQHASSTPSANVATTNDGIWDIWSDNSGKLAQGWLDLTEVYAWSGANTHAGDETFSGANTFAAQSTTTHSGLDYNIFNVRNFTCAEAITAGKALYSTTTKVALADDTNATTTAYFVGFSKGDCAEGETVPVQTNGIFTTSGLTAGKDYLVQTSGAISTATSTSGITAKFVGRAISTTELNMDTGYGETFLGFAADSSDIISVPDYVNKVIITIEGTDANDQLDFEATLNRYGRRTVILKIPTSVQGNTQVMNAVWDTITDKITLSGSGTGFASIAGTGYFYR